MPSKGKSPTARSLERLRAEGFIAEVVEKVIPGCFIKRDFIHCIDIIAFNAAETLGVQATSGSNHAARRTKALAIPELHQWLAGPNRHFEVWSWAKPRPGGGRKWELRRERIVVTPALLHLTAACGCKWNGNVHGLDCPEHGTAGVAQ